MSLDRRRFLAAITGGLLAAPLAAEAQQVGKSPRIAFISATASRDSPRPRGFQQGLRDLGYQPSPLRVARA